MAHFARIEDGVVRQVVVVSNCDIGGCVGEENVPAEWWNTDDHKNCGTLEYPDTEPLGQAFIASLGLDGEWRQTSYHGSFRGLFAGQGMVYDPVGDVFTLPEAE